MEEWLEAMQPCGQCPDVEPNEQTVMNSLTPALLKEGQERRERFRPKQQDRNRRLVLQGRVKVTFTRPPSDLDKA